MRKDSDNAAFFSANSVQKPKNFPKTREGQEAQTNYKLGTQLPYLFIVNRLAHYIKVLQREQIGSWKERQDLERELNTWLKQYIADQENPSSDVRSRRPLRAAQIVVQDVAGDPGWYQVSLVVRPHFKYMGANFEISWSAAWTLNKWAAACSNAWNPTHRATAPAARMNRRASVSRRSNTIWNKCSTHARAARKAALSWACVTSMASPRPAVTWWWPSAPISGVR